MSLSTKKIQLISLPSNLLVLRVFKFQKSIKCKDSIIILVIKYHYRVVQLIGLNLFQHTFLRYLSFNSTSSFLCQAVLPCPSSFQSMDLQSAQNIGMSTILDATILCAFEQMNTQTESVWFDSSISAQI